MRAFCEECHENQTFITKDVEITRVIKGREIRFNGKEAYCSVCNNPVHVPEIRDYNLQQLDQKFREVENLITIEQINMVLNRYNIGKRPLSELLGWGEVTITRYLDGAIPTKQYSEKLFELLENPNRMKELLEKNGSLISDVAVKKTRAAVDFYLGNPEEGCKDDCKIDHVVKYCLAKMVDVTPLALQKLLYYAQAFNKVINREFMFNDDCEAWVHGPVYREIYYRYKNFGYNPIEDEMEFDEEEMNLTNNEKEILDSVIANLGCYSGRILEKMTHSEKPWLETRNGIHVDAADRKSVV